MKKEKLKKIVLPIFIIIIMQVGFVSALFNDGGGSDLYVIKLVRENPNYPLHKFNFNSCQTSLKWAEIENIRDENLKKCLKEKYFAEAICDFSIECKKPVKETIWFCPLEKKKIEIPKLYICKRVIDAGFYLRIDERYFAGKCPPYYKQVGVL